jgi:hypothetical protein
MSGVFLEESLDPGLEAELVTALKQRDVMMASAAGSARFRISGGVELGVRSANIGNTTTFTADFLATIVVLNQATGQRETQRIEGRALGFSETAARTAGLRAAAEQMADAIRQVTRR